MQINRIWQGKDWQYSSIERQDLWNPSDTPPGARDNLVITSGTASIKGLNTSLVKIYLGGHTEVPGLQIDSSTVKLYGGVNPFDQSLEDISLPRMSFVHVTKSSNIDWDNGGGRTGATYAWHNVDKSQAIVGNYTLSGGGSTIIYGEGTFYGKSINIINSSMTAAVPVLSGSFELGLMAHMEFQGYADRSVTAHVSKPFSTLDIWNPKAFHAYVRIEDSDTEVRIHGVSATDNMDFYTFGGTDGMAMIYDAFDQTKFGIHIDAKAAGGFDAVIKGDVLSIHKPGLPIDGSLVEQWRPT